MRMYITNPSARISNLPRSTPSIAGIRMLIADRSPATMPRVLMVIGLGPNSGAAMIMVISIRIDSAAPVFVVFFALAGANLELAALARLWPVVIPIVLARVGGIWIGTHVGGRWARLPALERDSLWMGLVSQAGVAIGLVTVASAVYPAAGGDMRTILLSVIAVNETMGAILFRRSLIRAGEAPADPAGFPNPLSAH